MDPKQQPFTPKEYSSLSVIGKLALALGLDRPKTIGDWLPPLDEMARRARQPEASDTWQKRQPIRDLVGLFVEKAEVGFRPGRYGKTAQWTLKVSLADPIMPDHALLTELLTLLVETEDPAWIDILLDAQDDAAFEARIAQGRSN